jgi:NAD+ diphosphatase
VKAWPSIRTAPLTPAFIDKSCPRDAVPGFRPTTKDSLLQFTPGFKPVTDIGQPGWWFLFRDQRLLVRENDQGASVLHQLTADLLPSRHASCHYLGTLDRQPCLAAELSGKAVPPPGTALLGLRDLFEGMDPTLLAVAGRAGQILRWDRLHRFCGRCGAPTHNKSDERAKICSVCNQIYFPRVSPAVIGAIVNQDRILLASSPRFPAAFYSVLAGFVEPGETLEEAFRREVREEVGIEIANIRYFSSQPWPFPDSLMVGFVADYAGGEICPDGTEISHAAWFTADDLPHLPGPYSIARHLIDWFLERPLTQNSKPEGHSHAAINPR